MSASFQTLNSGAFRSLHCLIYKVLAPLRSARNIHYFTTTFSVCQALFQLFSKFFAPASRRGCSVAQLSYHRRFRLSSTFFDFFQNLFRTGLPEGLSFDSSITLPQLPDFVKPFFRFSQESFASFLFQPRPSATARLIYHFSPALSSAFCHFFKFFLNHVSLSFSETLSGSFRAPECCRPAP